MRSLIAPGTVLYLPSAPPKFSILFSDPLKPPSQILSNPILILHHSPTHEIIKFLPLVRLENIEKEFAASKAKALIWPKYVLISESWAEEDIVAEHSDLDFFTFPLVNLASESFRVNQKLWVKVGISYRIETKFLLQYPVSRAAANKKVQLQRIPNPQVFLEPEDLQAIRSLQAQWTNHPLVIEPRIPEDVVKVNPASVRRGHIYRLPMRSHDPILRSAQNYSFFERPLGKPFLVTNIGKLRDEERIAGFALTSFHDAPVTKYLKREDDKTRWIRSQYLPIEGEAAQAHDKLPIIYLGPGSPRFKGIWYVNAKRKFWISSNELFEWSGAEAARIFVRHDMVRMITDYHVQLHEESMLWEELGNPLGSGIAHDIYGNLESPPDELEDEEGS